MGDRNGLYLHIQKRPLGKRLRAADRSFLSNNFSSAALRKLLVCKYPLCTRRPLLHCAAPLGLLRRERVIVGPGGRENPAARAEPIAVARGGEKASMPDCTPDAQREARIRPVKVGGRGLAR